MNKADFSQLQFPWHSLENEKIFSLLKTSPDGLTEESAKERLERFGFNLIPEEEKFLKWKVFLAQFKSPLIYILILAGIITLILAKWTDAIVIFLAVIISAIFGFWEENKTSKILEKLKKALKNKALVLRNGHLKEVFQEEIVPGDVIVLKAGDKVPADGRLIFAKDLKVSEAILTGEWLPVNKQVEVLKKDTPLAERKNMVYMGCLVEDGEGKAVVVATGEQTEVGKIAKLIKETKKEETPLQKKVAHFGKIIGLFLSFICMLIFIGGVLRKGDWVEMFETAIAIAVGGIPESLPIVMTLVMVVGMERILKKKGLIRKLSSVETLGSASVICFDKTKTLTQGKMSLAEFIAIDQELAIKTALLANDAFIENPEEPIKKWIIKGSPTEKALLEIGIKNKILKPELEKFSKEINKLPFNPVDKFQISLRKEKDEFYLYITGAPERIIKLTGDSYGWKEKLNNLAKKGLRVIGLAYKKIDPQEISEKKDLKEMAKGSNFVGLVAFQDPIRKEAKIAIQVAQSAGLIPIIITGDHIETAKAIAQKVGLEVKDNEIIEGQELDKLNDQQLAMKLEKIKIYARAEPRHKIRVVSLWQKKGKIVAMVGDGVNDAPAIKKSDIGIALNSGTEVAKEAADLILLNDSFSIIVKAIEEGRVILSNLRKSIAYVMGDSLASVILVGVAHIIFGWPLPILPVQILWNNIVEDTFPTIAYAFEPKEKGIMKRGPTSPKIPLLTKEMKILIFGTGTINQFFGLLLFWWLWGNLGLSLDYVRTMVFGVICINTAFVIYSYKSLNKNIWSINPFSNIWLVISSLIVFVAYGLAIYFPPLQVLLKTVPLGLKDWLILVSISTINMFLIEITKWYFVARHQSER